MNASNPYVLDVGQCDFDHAQISHLLAENFRAEVRRSYTLDDALASVRDSRFDLILVNRVLDRDGSSGLDLIRRLKTDSETRDIPVMLVSNFADAQDAAVAVGALRGFGKAALGHPQTVSLLARTLDSH